MSAPTLTACIANYNHAKTIGRQIKAMASQSRPPDELIVVDDCSTDNSIEVIESYARDIPFLRLIRHEENQKLSAAIQTALKASAGDFFYSGGADDCVCPGFFERAMALATRQPDIGIVIGAMEVRSSDEVFEAVYGPASCSADQILTPDEFYRTFLCVEPSTRVYSSSVIYRKAAFLEHGGFRSELGSAADNFVMRLLGMLYGAAYVDLCCSVWFRNAGSMSDAASINPWRGLDLAARIAWLMQNEYPGVFPVAHIEAWQNDYRNHAIETTLAKLKLANQSSKWTYRRGTQYTGVVGRLICGTIDRLHRVTCVLQERTLLRVLSGYEGNIDCYTEESK